MKFLNPLNCICVYAGTIIIGASRREENKISIPIHLRIAILIFFTAVLMLTWVRTAKQVIDDPNIVEIKYSDLEIKSEKLGNILIGENRNYIFIYSLVDSIATTISRSQIEYIRIQQPKSLKQRLDFLLVVVL